MTKKIKDKIVVGSAPAPLDLSLEQLSQAAAAMGRRKSAARAAASRANGKLGGRPRKVNPPTRGR